MWKKARLIFYTLLFLIFVASLPVLFAVSKQDLMVEEIWTTPYGLAERANYGGHWEGIMPKKMPHERPWEWEPQPIHYRHWNLIYRGETIQSFDYQEQ